MVCKVCIEPGAYLFAALAILIFPARWWLAVFLAAAVHETGHLLMVHLFGGQVQRIRIGAIGAKIEIDSMGRGREALCALAGPAGSLILSWAVSRVLPEAALCALVQGLFNLLPIYPLDGGRILRCFASYPICMAAKVFTLILLSGLGIWLSVAYDLGLCPMIPAALAVMQLIPRKIPCKEPKLAVQ